MTMPLNLTPFEAERWAYANGDAQCVVFAQLADAQLNHERARDKWHDLREKLFDLAGEA